MPDYTILLIDYEPRSLERSRRPLTNAGYRVEIARDGLAGMEAFERIKPDLVLVEAMIPKKHGFEVCQDLKKTPQGKRTPILITTAVYKGRKYRSQALHLYGCDDYLEKPIPEEQLVTVCARFLGDEDVAGRLARLQGVPLPPAAPAVPPAPEPVAAVPRAGDAEREILARLDAILPGSSTSGADEAEIEVVLDEPSARVEEAPRAEVALAPEPPKQVISLDEARARKRHKKGRGGSGRSGSGRGAAAASPEPSPVPVAEPMLIAAGQPMLVADPSPRAETRLLPDPIPLTDLGAQSGLPPWVWLLAVAGLLGVFALLWLMLST